MQREIGAWRAVALGAATGLRTFVAPVLLSRIASRGRIPEIQNTRFAPLASPVAAYLLTLAAIGEMVADKLPMAPSRTENGALFARLISGAVSGAAMHTATGRNAGVGTALGGAGALAAAYAGEWYRDQGAQARVPDPVLAVLEDAAAVGLALLALRDL